MTLYIQMKFMEIQPEDLIVYKHFPINSDLAFCLLTSLVNRIFDIETVSQNPVAVRGLSIIFLFLSNQSPVAPFVFSSFSTYRSQILVSSHLCSQQLLSPKKCKAEALGERTVVIMLQFLWLRNSRFVLFLLLPSSAFMRQDKPDPEIFGNIEIK